MGRIVPAGGLARGLSGSGQSRSIGGNGLGLRLPDSGVRRGPYRTPQAGGAWGSGVDAPSDSGDLLSAGWDISSIPAWLPAWLRVRCRDDPLFNHQGGE